MIYIKSSSIAEAWDSVYEEDDIVAATKIANGICKAIVNGAYKKGRRNTIAVDLSCSCHILKIDPHNITRILESEGHLDYVQMKNLISRLDVIDGYLDSWDWNSSVGVFEYMLDVDKWEEWDDNIASGKMFELV